MKLVIFPGGGSPDNGHYRKVYELLADRAIAYGYTDVDILRWPGHADASGCDPGSRLTLDGALKVAYEKLHQLESTGQPYRILGRSFGTIVAAQVTTTLGLTGLENLVLWGPPPHWLGWKLCLRGLGAMKEKFKDKGTYMDESYYHSLVPFESLLTEVRTPTVIATGTEDPYSPPSFLAYLMSLAVGNPMISFRPPVNGARHEVTTESGDHVVHAYCETVLA